MQDKLQVGIIASTHGLKGEVKVYPTTDDSGRFQDLKEVILETDGKEMLLRIEGVKFFKKFVILKFKSINTIEEVEKYKGKSLYVTRENAVKLEQNEYFIADLIGLQVVDEEENKLGILRDVIQTGANDVYEVALTAGGEVLIPAIQQCILRVDMEEGSMKVHLLEGLMEE